MNKNLILAVVFILVIIGGIYLFYPTKPSNKNSLASITPTQAIKLPEKSQGIILTKSGFEPSEIKVKVKTLVVWINKSGGPATVNSDNHPTHLLYPFLNLGEFANESSVQVKFDSPGRYTYHNHLNPEQKGTVVVE
ncbi:MAG: hypothetical protein CO135_03010 [Candidatus Levybacteria bacterium CG_4_9_14_3_um_filter_35_16]|nr:MAG: hypothetical protein COW87_03675 [Candidatus Levybacteria bacterium CG22_combo_CG10-13_8_21_14_all_35_11]PIY93834.1 MAG: hypothetical protein COY68_04720 [Candidatus Levybacteria bacterium CG_4_10_14_0_8_um_filter_35_23]PJA91105.1 MAG: hypothetical protein CO135_03010 [Candidatus Levybacteria bacterium CG_4_9_14_3_um_filter_35_16]PJC54456.1 MAG: hypothetical protein CO028_02170 [Candidatus Levybacteria bacterium CG_4_9_14_0_2_um_filter_35_21]